MKWEEKLKLYFSLLQSGFSLPLLNTLGFVTLGSIYNLPHFDIDAPQKGALASTSTGIHVIAGYF